MMLLTVLSMLVLSNGQNCPSWKQKNEAKYIDQVLAPGTTTNAPDPNWPGPVGGGYWSRNDFPRDPIGSPPDEITNQNFTTLFGPPSPYVYIDANDPDGQNKFDTQWKPLNMSVKLKESPNVRPAGYKYAFIRAFNKNIPCIRVDARTRGHGLEIAVYAEEDHRICIRDIRNAANAGINNQANIAFTTVCGQQRVKHCFVTPDDEAVNFEIYADTPYELTNGFGVFYRLRQSRFPYKDSGNGARSASTEMWCMMLNGIDWPEFTGATPQNGLDIPATNAARGISSGAVFVAALVAGVVAAL